MISLKTNTPQAILLGIDDQSRVNILPEFTPVPIHNPLFYILSKKGPEIAFVNGAAFASLYDAESINPRSKFYNHQTLAMEGCFNMGNNCLVKRIIPPDATSASLTVTLTVDKTTPIYQYQRDSDGTVVTDTSGTPQFTTDIVPNGVLLKYEIVPVSTFEQGAGTGVYDFSPIGPTEKRIYPLLTFLPPSLGEYGNSTGIRMWHMGQNTATPADLDVVNFQQALSFAIQLVERAVDNTTVVIESIFGDRAIDFMFKPGAYNQKTDVNLSINRVVTKYNDDGKLLNTTPTLGPIKGIKVEQNNIETVLNKLLILERATSPKDISNIYMLNFLTATDIDDVANYGFQIDTSGIKFVESRTHYMVGGSDGTVTPEMYNIEVGKELDFNFENSKYPLMDMPMYPFSTLYDTGFPLEIKKKFFKWLGRRKDIYVVCSTFIDGMKDLSLSEEISIATSLRASAAIYAESDFYGTAACRVQIFGQSGEMVNHPYEKRVGLVQDYIRKVADYEGAGNGKFKVKGGFNRWPKSVVNYVKNVNNTHMGVIAKDTAWGTGMNYAQTSDMNELFYAAYQTIYPFKNSILTSSTVMHICCDLEKVLYKVWIQCTGDDSTPDDLFIKQSNEIFNGLVTGKYDNRCELEPNTYIDGADLARGFTWHMKAIIRAHVMRTIAIMTVEAQRFKAN